MSWEGVWESNCDRCVGEGEREVSCAWERVWERRGRRGKGAWRGWKGVGGRVWVGGVRERCKGEADGDDQFCMG